MTVDIMRAEHNAIAALDNSNAQLAKLAQWVEAASNARHLVAPLIDTFFMPDAYRPKVPDRATPEQRAEAYNRAIANATAAVLHGLSLGWDPLVSLQQVYVIHGRPGLYAKAMVALVQSHGHEVWVEDLSDSRAVVCGRRKGIEHVERVTITMDMAKKAKWTSNAKYQETPQDMLWARAAARVCDRIASDVLKGIASVEEINDTIHVEATVGTGTHTVIPPRRRAAPERPQTALPAATAPEPPLEPETPAQPQPAARQAPAASTPAASATKLINQPQMKKLHALLRDTGRGDDREYALAHIITLIDRDIESTKELTHAEATIVIDALLAEKNEEAEMDKAAAAMKAAATDPDDSDDDDGDGSAEDGPDLTDNDGSLFNQHEPARRGGR